MKTLSFSRFWMAAFGLLILLVSPAGGAAQAATTSCGSWSVVRSPNQIGAGFRGVAAVSTNDVWAVGDYGYAIFVTLIEHWNGTKWSIVKSPNIPGYDSELYAVAAVSTNDVWAVGTANNDPKGPLALIEHWDGSTWSIISSTADTPVQLFGIAVVSATDIWAVGAYNDLPLAEHWNGARWSIAPTPNQGYGSALNGVTALASNNVWAIGYYTDNNNNAQTLIEHWNGTKWSVISSPSHVSSGPNTGPPPMDNILYSVAASSATDIWAVGNNTNQYPSSTLIEHWNGAKWSMVSSPTPLNTWAYLQGVAVVSSINVWAVGYSNKMYNNSGPYKTLIEHWDGTKWSMVKSPNPAKYGSLLDAIAAAPGSSSLWTVGVRFGRTYPEDKTLVESYC